MIMAAYIAATLPSLAADVGRGAQPDDNGSGSNPSDDDAIGILEGSVDNPTRRELAAAPDALADDRKIEILALTGMEKRKVMIRRMTICTAIMLAFPLSLAITGLAWAELPGKSLAERWCSQCHAVKPNQVSPNPKAPAFSEIAAQPSITEYTLRVFLQTEHAKMPNFILKPDVTDDLVDYIISLKPAR